MTCTWYAPARTRITSDVPASLKGADFVPAAKADRAYSTVDLMERRARRAVVSIAYAEANYATGCGKCVRAAMQRGSVVSHRTDDCG